MALLDFFNGIAQYGQAIGQAKVARASASLRKAEFDINARNNEFKAKEIREQGDEFVKNYQDKLKKIKGSQRARLGASGIRVDVGSAADVQQETDLYGALDVENIKNNAWRQAFGFEQQAISDRFQGRLAEIEGEASAEASILGGKTGVYTGLVGFGLSAAKAGG